MKGYLGTFWNIKGYLRTIFMLSKKQQGKLREDYFLEPLL